MKHKVIEPKDWDHSEDENKKLVRTVFSKMGGDKSKITVKKIDYAMEVTHQDFEVPVVITRQYFDDKNLQAIEKILSPFLK